MNGISKDKKVVIDEYEKEHLNSRYFKDYALRVLTPTDRNKTRFCCPFCGSTPDDQNPAGVINEEYFFCHRCEKSADIFDLVQLFEPVDNFPAAKQWVKENYEGGAAGVSVPIRPQVIEKPALSNTLEWLGSKVSNDQLKTRIRKAQENPEPAYEYFAKRGLTAETCRHFGVGYEARTKYMKDVYDEGILVSYEAHKPYCIIRNTAVKGESGQIRLLWKPVNVNKYTKELEHGDMPLFHPEDLKKCLEDGEPLFIVEGAPDAMSIYQAGGRVSALIGTAVTCLKQQLEVCAAELSEPRTLRIIWASDDDESGKEAFERFKNKVLPEFEGSKIQIEYVQVVWSEYAGKDANEYLIEDAEKFKADVLRNIERGRNAAEAQKEEDKAEVLASMDNVLNYLESDSWLQEVADLKKNADRKTGFYNLDEVQPLYPGLYLVGAISSLGKTTFIHQMADNIAEAGEHVIFFSMEQSRLEMVSKSLSRMSFKLDPLHAVSAIDIRRGTVTKEVFDAVDAYKPIAERMHVVNCTFETTVSDIIAYVDKFTAAMGVKPVVVVDYLQVIAPEDAKTQKTAMDITSFNIKALKTYQRDNQLTMFVICSLNRANYLLPVDFESFKNSGDIEYTADVVWGLQLSVLETHPVFDKESKLKEKRAIIRQAKKAIPRQIQLVCLKNRFGTSSFSKFFEYNPVYDTFKGIDYPAAEVYQGVLATDEEIKQEVEKWRNTSQKRK